MKKIFKLVSLLLTFRIVSEIFKRKAGQLSKEEETITTEEV